jgi:signal transduction histidine kinase
VVIEGVRRWDVALAAATLAAAWIEVAALQPAHATTAVLTSLYACAALAFRRARPVAVAVICTSAQVVNQWGDVPVSDLVVPVVWLVISIYTMARWCTLRRAIVGQVVVSALFVSTLFLDDSDWFFGLMVGYLPFLVGLAFRANANQNEELTERVSTMERQREAEVTAALAEERARIARDLHDVIAHSVTVMLVQAGAAQEVLATDPGRATLALSSVQEAGRQALREMSTLLGMQHGLPDDGSLSPQPGLDQLGPLIRQAGAGGIPVTLTITGEPYDVSPGIQVSLYRVVQESMTNARKHSSATRIGVTLTYAAREVVAEIRNDGAPTGTGQGSGRGIVGMRERVDIYGGRLDAGPCAEGGYRVVASIPMEVAR